MIVHARRQNRSIRSFSGNPRSHLLTTSGASTRSPASSSNSVSMVTLNVSAMAGSRVMSGVPPHSFLGEAGGFAKFGDLLAYKLWVHCVSFCTQAVVVLYFKFPLDTMEARLGKYNHGLDL